MVTIPRVRKAVNKGDWVALSTSGRLFPDSYMGRSLAALEV